ncbi:hypothetical protein [Methylobacter sp. YRD-M1]|uniref:hypothetical protein n=1 Tax=Methylobacter sp. YRD-M1 TaxID=2911520 RepID=UPI00227B0189|nr:hypothetical protein [Methylobacter sp. YRD-M1]WAK01104.1 hypothetical protein LZ558_14860 [Methylobacter sp. YRD-M1]
MTLLLGTVLTAPGYAADFTVNVVDQNGNPAPGFRWQLQEDATFPVDPNHPATNPQDRLSTTFHKSYHPLAHHADGTAVRGNTDSATTTVNDVPAGRYYISVLPYQGYSMSGAPVTLDDAGNQTVTVTVESHPTPTAQITVYLFHDNFPINGAPDLPEEQNPAAGQPGHVDWSTFNVTLEEPAGRYGHNGGPVLEDAFGNLLGTQYDADGNVTQMGDGTLHPNPDGTLTIKNLSPGKYGVLVNPPSGSNWAQTATIEGTRVNDAWVKANEPEVFVEFGPPGPHVFFGFVKSTADGGFLPLSGSASVSGSITDMHMSRPPAVEFFSGRPFPQCWVGVNETVAGIPGRGIYAAPCDAGSNFNIAGLAPGSYELKVFDKPLDVIIASLAFTVDDGGNTCNGGQPCNFGEVPVFNWFHRLQASVFNDTNQNGFRDSNETNVSNGAATVNLRWRDGSIYQSFPVDTEGVAPFDEVFPFFHWMVAEVSSANKKATGVTVVVDAGGPVDKSSDAFPGYGALKPQPQTEVNINTGDNLSRTEAGPVLTQGIQGFLGQTNIMKFGKTDYKTFGSGLPPSYIGENGGISGIVFYATTRAENDPRQAIVETWEPGIPRVQVALYADGDINCPFKAFPNDACDIDWNGNGTKENNDNVIDDVNRNGTVDLADIDNAPLGWSQGGLKGPEDVDRNSDGLFDYGDALAVVWTDSWDDNLPTGCPGQNLLPGLAEDACFDGLRNFNQVRPAVFDGGYAFTSYNLDKLPQPIRDKLAAFYAQQKVAEVGFTGLLPADYIVQVSPPPGYDIIKEEDENVEIGDIFTPAPQALPTVCVGDAHVVPPFLSLATKDGSGNADQVIAAYSDKTAPFAGQTRPLCDLREVPLSAAQNAAADFFLKTDVPIVANVAGGILNDLANEFNPNTPNFGEKYAPPHLPVAFYDWNGKLVNRVYADQFGKFNAVLPSTSTADRPQPSGMAPNMLISCMNDAGPIPAPGNPGQMILDPFYNPQFSQFCYTFQYMPGVATYLDTPVVPIAAFANPSTHPVDCERPTQTPVIAQLTRHPGDGGGGPFALAGQRIQITSAGEAVQVPNPDWDGTANTPRTITRDYNFGARPSVFLESAEGLRMPMTNIAGGGGNINARVPFGTAPGDYQVIVRRNQGARAPEDMPIGVTLTVGVQENVVRRASGLFNGAVRRVPAQFPTIQRAIDNAAAGDLILVAPGVYNELVIMWKPVKLQGWGAGVTTINARQVPTENIIAWRDKVRNLVENGSISKLPGQVIGLPGFPALNEGVFPTEEGAGIDGFSIIGASTGGGIVVNGYAQDLVISNNRITGNSGIYSGGIRIGHPSASHQEGGILAYDDAVNDRIRIHHNHVAQNGSTFGGSGGIALNTGADQYRVQNNWVCGNFSQGNGGGIGHSGLSNGGLIQDNLVIFNESFNQGNSIAGGGIFVGGQPALQADPTTGLLLSPGAGNDIVIDGNTIRGNLAGAGDGGGLMIAGINGLDVAANPGNRAPWSDVGVYNNLITNNVSALAGGGISIGDSLMVDLRNNTIAHNESTATAALAFAPGNPSQSNPLPAGIVSRVHSAAMSALMNTSGLNISVPADRQAQWLSFSDPVMDNNIIYQNRSWFWLNFDDPATATIETGLFPSNCNAAPTGCNVNDINAFTDDIAVLDGATDTGKLMNIRFSLLTDNADNQAEYIGQSSNITGNPAFVNGYHNGPRDETLLFPEATVLQTAGAFDEGGNFIQVAYGPLSLVDTVADPVGNPNGTMLFDYHIAPSSAAANRGVSIAGNNFLLLDIDNQLRLGAAVDIGADEQPAAR